MNFLICYSEMSQTTFCNISKSSVLFSHHFTYLTLSFSNTPVMADSMMSKAATMEIPINSNGDSRNLAEDDSLEQVSDTW